MLFLGGVFFLHGFLGKSGKGEFLMCVSIYPRGEINTRTMCRDRDRGGAWIWKDLVVHGIAMDRRWCELQSMTFSSGLV
jgi:hypothetical protein